MEALKRRPWAAALVIAMVVGSAFTTAPTAIARMRVIATGPTPLVAPAGARISLTATFRGGRGRPGLLLAKTAHGARGATILLGPSPAVNATRRHRRRRITVAGTVPSTIPTGQTLFLLVCVDARGAAAGRRVSCRSAGPLPVSGPGLEERLQAALAAKRLSPGKRLLYSMYALDADPRLPVELRGAPSDETSAESLIREVSGEFGSLPKSVQRQLVWFFAPPTARGSQWRGAGPAKPVHGVPAAASRNTAVGRIASGGGAGAIAGRIAGASPPEVDCAGYKGLSDSPYAEKRSWVGVPTSDGHAIVWYQEGFPEAQASARLYARVMPEIWTKLTKEFGPPLSDAKEPCYHGPDGRFDIYVDDAITFLAAGGFATRGAGGFLAITMPYPSNGNYPLPGQFCTERPAWIAIKPGNGRWALAHEFMHALQFAHRYLACKAPTPNVWWDEGQATWAADFVYPTDDYEKEHFPDWVTKPLEQGSIVEASYWAYPFWMMLQRTQGTDVLRAIFAQLRSQLAPQAVDAAVPGGLAKQWPRFAIQVWNQAPVGTPSFPYSESFLAWDRWSATPAHPAPVELTLAPQAERTYELPMQNPLGVQPLTIGSYDELNASDASARELKFKNGLAGKGHVEAILYLSDGTRKLEDWTGKNEVKLCRDRPEEDVTKLLVVTTNPSPTAGIPAYRHKMTVANRCEPETVSGPFSGSEDLSTQAEPIPIKLSWKGTVTLHEKERLPFASADTFDLVGGSVEVEVSGMIENCRIAGSATLDLLASNPGPLPGVLAVIDGTPRTEQVTLAALLGKVPFTFHECEDEGKTGEWPLLDTALLFTPQPLPPVTAPGVYQASLTGSPGPGEAHYTWNWNLRRVN